MEEALSLEDIWTELLQTISGKLILVHDFNKFKAVLQENAMHYGLTYPVIFGESLGLQAKHYFHKVDSIQLDKLCGWIGYPLPAHPQQTAFHRALGYLHILQAMAQGLITIQAKEEITEKEWSYNEYGWENN